MNKYYKLEFGSEESNEKRIYFATHIVKVSSKKECEKWLKDILKDNFKRIDKSIYKDVSRKLHKYSDCINNYDENQSADLYSYHAHKYNDECLDLLFCEVWKSSEDEYENGQSSTVDCIELD